jgi:hypothetical protein
MTHHDEKWFDDLLEKLDRAPGFVPTRDHDGKLVLHQTGCEAIADQTKVTEKTIQLNQIDRLCDCMGN